MSINLQYPSPLWSWVQCINQLILHVTKLTSTDFDVTGVTDLYQTTIIHTLYEEQIWIVSHKHECSNQCTWYEQQIQRILLSFHVKYF